MPEEGGGRAADGSAEDDLVRQVARLRVRVHMHEAVAELGELAMNAEDPQPLLTLATRLVAEALGVDLSQVAELAPGGDHFTVRATSSGPAALGRRLSVGPGTLAGFALRKRTSVVCADLSAETRFAAPGLLGLGMASTAVVLVRGREHPFGLLAAHARAPRSFEGDEVHFLETVANVLAALLARHAAEAALLAREAQFRAVFENALDSLQTLDDEGRIVQSNPAACRLFGQPWRELSGRPVFPFYGPYEATARTSFAELRRVGRLAGEGTLAPPGLPPRHFEYSAVADIMPGLHLTIMRDVTERRVLQARLAVANRMASVGTLAAGVAHELNNPLSYVTANLAWLAETLSAAPAGAAEQAAARRDMDEAVGEARAGAERMKGIIRDLRTFSRGDEERTGAVELAPVLEACLSVAWNEIRHRARLVRDFADMPPVRGNEARLGQVFLNLIVNAAQSITEGAADRNEIRLTARRAPGDRVAVEVRDTGSGIAPEHLARIFDPFFTTKPLGVGTGLGLSICHNLVAALGGAIEVESAPGAGSTFRVLLPAWLGHADAPSAAPRATAQPARRGHVLVLDDEPLVGAAVRRALAEHHVTVVTHGTEALARLDAGDVYDVVVTDLLMPDMSGIEFHQRLEARAPDLARRVVFMTGGAFTPDTLAFVEAHRDDCLEKPFDLAKLREMVRSHLPPTPRSDD